MLATSMSSHGFAGNHVANRTLTDLERLVDDPATLMLSANNAIPSPQISGQGLEILSASQYPHALSEQYTTTTRGSSKRKATLAKQQTQQFYGGIVYNETRLSSSGEASNDDSVEQQHSPEPPRPRKRAKKNATVAIATDAGFDEGKKQRGRPRLDTQDETAADRRRTQIRLAQRAYRNRKETTISALKEKVNNLRSTIEQMNAAFVDLHDNLLDSGLCNGRESLIEQLEKMTADFESLSKTAAMEDDEDDEEMPKTASKEKQSKSQHKNTSKKNVTSSPSQKTQESDIEELPTTQFGTTSDLFGYNESWEDQSTEIMQFNVHVPEANVSLEDVVSETKMQLKLASKLERPLPVTTTPGFYTYSFQETSFARRLHRLCLERAFRNLTNPSIEPAYIKHVFRFTFCFSNRRRMLARFQDMLKRKAGEALENYNVPFFHIGGAGTHFPRKDKQGNKIFPPNMATPEAAITAPGFGPNRQEQWSVVETPRSEATTEELLEKLGFGGLWFDSHDVDEYLKTKGIVLDGTSSFIEVDPANLTLTTTLPGSPYLQASESPKFQSASSSATTSTLGSPPVRTPSPLSQGFGPVSIDYIPDHPYASQPPAQYGLASNESFYASFASATDAVQPYFTDLEKEFRSQDPLSQVQSVQARQIWPWADTMPTADAFSSLSWSADGTDMPLFNDSDTFDSFQPQSQQQLRLLNDGSMSAQPDLSNTASLLRALQRRGQPVTIDVEKFLERMVDGAACLGRAPGFRKEMVDNAVVMSLAEAF